MAISTIPAIFMSGRVDYKAPLGLVEEYVAGLEAPSGKHMIAFEQSAHVVFLEERTLFRDVMILVLGGKQLQHDFLQDHEHRAQRNQRGRRQHPEHCGEQHRTAEREQHADVVEPIALRPKSPQRVLDEKLQPDQHDAQSQRGG